MITIPIWILISSGTTLFSIGFAIGRYFKPAMTQDTTHCEILGNNRKWNFSKISRLFADNKCVNIGCPSFNAGTKICSSTSTKCDFID